MKIYTPDPLTGRISANQAYLKDKPNVYKNDGYFSATVDCPKGTGSFLMPNQSFGGPSEGDLVEVTLVKNVTKERVVFVGVITETKQDHVTREGKFILLTTKSNLKSYLDDYLLLTDND